MANYVDGFLLPVETKKLKAYKKMATFASKIWLEHGALEYRECVGDDMECPGLRSFEKAADAKKRHTVVFAWIVYKSKAHRKQVNQRVMTDKRMTLFDPKKMPFEMKDMSYGGFKVLVEAMAGGKKRARAKGRAKAGA